MTISGALEAKGGAAALSAGDGGDGWIFLDAEALSVSGTVLPGYDEQAFTEGSILP